MQLSGWNATVEGGYYPIYPMDSVATVADCKAHAIKKPVKDFSGNVQASDLAPGSKSAC